ncbi:tRNA (adenosine(37)-N6)-threonylcarbamoyltransferase complex dimerization subunit type 1 TsaB [Kangiella sediminilitoris]|uniref:tRNA threonylcarbamoyladenosine biosynthesis protein TsaB n=1 Tax=Kangiella sediminilitoris TaxID=1144748 RepID=A0A1B3BB52_9GAMM|nr:tRNA (adenosine(37)-N6)-threonylcarbamoyltransferase complex dimerization subunit type 1 TsaB [Kangiella sediminilitoris]AOE50023.1 Peptidase M22 glycoprotease [Kangiella sediminilitoris]
MANLLIIDTATESCSVALKYDDQVYTRSEIAPRMHGELVLPMVEAVLAEAGIKLTQLDAIAYGQGPGAFTGIRICISVVQGLAFGADLPVIGISSLQALAQGLYQDKKQARVLAAIDARMGEVYWGQYEVDANGLMKLLDQERVCSPEFVTISDPDTSIVYSAVGTGWSTYAKVLSETLNVPTVIHDKPLYPFAEYMIPMAEYLYISGESYAAELAVPVYLRDDVAKKAKDL